MRILDQVEINKRAKEIALNFPKVMDHRWIDQRFMINDLEFWDIAKIKSSVERFRYEM